MAEYKCMDCGITVHGNEDEEEICPVCNKVMKGLFRRKNCSLQPAEQLGATRS
jgi:rubrerythrin